MGLPGDAVSGNDYLEFARCLDSLIALNIKHRKSLPDLSKELSIIAYAQELCTVRCDIGRRTGKTRYIKERADKNSLVVVANRAVLETCFRDVNFEVKTAFQLERRSMGFEAKKNIYVDEPKLVFHDIDELTFYKSFARNSDQTFILLGRS